MSIFESIGSGLKAVANAVDDALPDVGDIAEKICDKAGLPEWLGDGVSLGVDLFTGNYVAAATDAIDLADNVFSEPDPPSIRTDRSQTETAGPGEAASRASDTQATLDIKNLTDADLMQLVRDDAIPKEILDDKGSMLSLQKRMQDIQEMNALLTSLTRAMHEMQMEIIRNVRA